MYHQENTITPWEVMGLVSKCMGKEGGKRALVFRLKIAFIPLWWISWGILTRGQESICSMYVIQVVLDHFALHQDLTNKKNIWEICFVLFCFSENAHCSPFSGLYKMLYFYVSFWKIISLIPLLKRSWGGDIGRPYNLSGVGQPRLAYPQE